MPTDPISSPASIAPKAITFTPAQLLADNLSTRVREMVAILAFAYLARTAVIPGTWALIAILALVLPIEITRQLIKPAVARFGAGGVGPGAAVVLFAALVYKLHSILVATGPILAAVVALTACNATQGAQFGQTLKVGGSWIDSICRAQQSPVGQGVGSVIGAAIDAVTGQVNVIRELPASSGSP